MGKAKIVTNYFVLGGNIGEISNKVKTALEDGWELYGSISTLVFGNVVFVYQPITRKEFVDDESDE
jgi:hypothetical protein